jgi:uncharacterized protein
MLNQAELKSIEGAVGSHNEFVFAYVHGSSLYSAKAKDIDIAVYLCNESLNRSRYFDIAIPLEQELEKSVKKPFDVQILNRAPLSFRFRVISGGELILDRSPGQRERFELISRVEYFDFKPHREEYLKEAFA